MKRTIYSLICFLISANFLLAQNPIIFRPGPGANNGSDEGNLSGGKDAWTYEGDPTTNYGDYVSIQALPISNCNSTSCSAFIQFDLSTLPAAVDSVFLVFKHASHTAYCLSGCDANFYFARITQAWNEMTIDYTNIPTKDTAFYGPINITFPNDFGERKYDITNTYSLWKSGSAPNYGMTIYSTTIACNNAAVFFSVSSSDDTSATNRPYLKIYESITGIQNNKASGFNLQCLPNPASDLLHLNFNLKNSEYVKIQLFDLTGRMVFDKESIMNEGPQAFSIPLTAFESGLYFYCLSTKDGCVSGKVMKN